MGLLKRALIRDPNAPPGVTADLYIQCCGNLLLQPLPPFAGVACPTCRTVYNREGWIDKPLWLLVIDRETGETERIPSSDGNFAESIRGTAERLGMSAAQAMQLLADGQELCTAGFIRRLSAE